MREWNIKPGDPLSLTLAADTRLGPTSYCDDQIWEICLGGGEPPALALQTTYGLRARSLRIFPRFTDGELSRSDPDSFTLPPSIRYFSPNYYYISFAPFSEIQVVAEYWAPGSQTTAGRFRITNASSTEREIRLDLISLLTPNGEGQRMLPDTLNGVSVLIGGSGGLTPVVFLAGGVQPSGGPYPALSIILELKPGDTHAVTWGQAALPTPEASLELARESALRSWEAELARIDMLNSGLVEIHSGNPDWDAAFSLSQKVAYGLLAGPSEHLPDPSFVLAREPGNGYSLRGNGLDYNYQWNGQAPLDTWYLAGLLLPASPHLVAGFLNNYFVTAKPAGNIDWRPGLAGQLSRLLATPLLAAITARLMEYTGDRDFLANAFPHLLSFFWTWFQPEHDRDGDGVPEWSHSLHSGFDEHPLFSHWSSFPQGPDISTAESPALCSFLYNEAQSLIKIGHQIGQQEKLPAVEEVARGLRTAVEISWDTAEYGYRYWDRDSHFSSISELLGSRTGNGRLSIERSFDQPVRLIVNLQMASTQTFQPQIYIHGSSLTGQHIVENITPSFGGGVFNRSKATGARLYSRVEFITVEGLNADEQVSVFTAGYQYQDQTQFLPLWAGIPAPERAEALVKQNLTEPERFWKPYGIPACLHKNGEDEAGICQHVYLPWNALIGEGLLAYGYRAEAADLVTRLMNAVVKTLKREGLFRKHYHPITGQGIGESNSLDGLAPLGLFLSTLGVRIYTNRKVGLEGINPFPTPITVKYRGLTVLRQKEKSIVIFPDGQTSTVDSPAPCIVSLE